ncbi:MAG: type II CRISPR-associated endonuclease Cas1, partial [Bacteroidales bacterium]|nr:type II CRISPR-associated endonuclease Cas1 [Bacteroidales bacterium]
LDLCGLDGDILSPHVRNVLSGDTTNREGVAARLYWTEMFDEAFVRDREGDGINALLNYGYAILRAATIRALIGSGVSPAFGIFHRNRYNAFPLADDVMEPFRPFVDIAVYELWKQGQATVNKKTKSRLLKILTCDVLCGDVMRPLMLALSSTTASLSSYILRKSQVLTLPQIP